MVRNSRIMTRVRSKVEIVLLPTMKKAKKRRRKTQCNIYLETS